MAIVKIYPLDKVVNNYYMTVTVDFKPYTNLSPPYVHARKREPPPTIRP